MAKFNDLGPAAARHIFSVGGALERDFQRLSREQASRLLIYADKYEY